MQASQVVNHRSPKLIHFPREAVVKKNIGTVDRSIRVLLALIVAVLYYTNQISGAAAIILGLFAVIFLLTSFMAFCPMYVPFKFSTKKEAA
jgi:small-conductance mechanosensitive channel